MQHHNDILHSLDNAIEHIFSALGIEHYSTYVKSGISLGLILLGVFSDGVVDLVSNKTFEAVAALAGVFTKITGGLLASITILKICIEAILYLKRALYKKNKRKNDLTK